MLSPSFARLGEGSAAWFEASAVSAGNVPRFSHCCSQYACRVCCRVCASVIHSLCTLCTPSFIHVFTTLPIVRSITFLFPLNIVPSSTWCFICSACLRALRSFVGMIFFAPFTSVLTSTISIHCAAMSGSRPFAVST